MQKTYRIYGEVAGTIWMPNVECSKDFNIRLQRVDRDATTMTAYSHGWPMQFRDLRDVLLNITNDGDFQSCSITFAVVEVTIHKGNKRITRSWELRGKDGNADCFAA